MPATTYGILLKLLKQLKLYRVSTRTHVMHVAIGVENELIINHHNHIGDETGCEYWLKKFNDVMNSRRAKDYPPESKVCQLHT